MGGLPKRCSRLREQHVGGTVQDHTYACMWMSLCVSGRPIGGESRELKAGGGEEGKERGAEQASTRILD